MFKLTGFHPSIAMVYHSTTPGIFRSSLGLPVQSMEALINCWRKGWTTEGTGVHGEIRS